MNNTPAYLQNDATDHQAKPNVSAPPVTGLELFAEELPAQQDLARPATQSSYSTATGGGSTASTFSTIACL